MKHEQFARNLKRVMAERGISQVKLSYATSINGRQIWVWCSGQNLPSLRNLAKMRMALGCTWDELLGEHGELVMDDTSMAAMAMEYSG